MPPRKAAPAPAAPKRIYKYQLKSKGAAAAGRRRNRWAAGGADGESLATGAYNAAAGFGRIMALFGAIIATIIAVALIAFGIWILVRKNKYSATATGTIAKAACAGNNCNVIIQFTPAGTTTPVTSNPMTLAGNFQSGQSIGINYDPSNPNNFQVQSNTAKIIAWLCIVIGVIMILLSWLWYYFTRVSKPAAAVTGVADGAGIIGSEMNPGRSSSDDYGDRERDDGNGDRYDREPPAPVPAPTPAPPSEDFNPPSSGVSDIPPTTFSNLQNQTQDLGAAAPANP